MTPSSVLLQLPASNLLQVGSHTSDLQELIGGQPWILVRIPASADASADESKLSGADKARSLRTLMLTFRNLENMFLVVWCASPHPPTRPSTSPSTPARTR